MPTSPISWKKWLPQYASIFDVRFSPPNQIQQLSTPQDTPRYFSHGFFSDKNSPSDGWFPPQPIPSPKFSVGIGTPGVPDVFIHCRSQLTTTMLSKRLGAKWKMLMIECLYGWVGCQISHCFAVLMAYDLYNHIYHIYIYYYFRIYSRYIFLKWGDFVGGNSQNSTHHMPSAPLRLLANHQRRQIQKPRGSAVEKTCSLTGQDRQSIMHVGLHVLLEKGVCKIYSFKTTQVT